MTQKLPLVSLLSFSIHCCLSFSVDSVRVPRSIAVEHTGFDGRELYDDDDDDNERDSREAKSAQIISIKAHTNEV